MRHDIKAGRRRESSIAVPSCCLNGASAAKILEPWSRARAIAHGGLFLSLYLVGGAHVDYARKALRWTGSETATA